MLDNAILVSLSRQVALRRQMDVIANNLANLQTGGFKSSQMLFQEYVMPQAEASAALPGDQDISYVIDRGTLQDFDAGPMRQTGNPLDVAIDGKGWFVVQTLNGERYTRNGSFQIDDQGNLVTIEGFRVQGDGGAITFDESDGTISIASDGTISTEAGVKGRLRIVSFGNEQDLVAEGSSTYSSPNPAQVVDNVRILQGTIEGSNVKPIVEMTRMIDVTRAYTTLSNMLEKTEDMRRGAIGVLSGAQ